MCYFACVWHTNVYTERGRERERENDVWAAKKKTCFQVIYNRKTR